jgi:pyruvate dehydrogenase E2 component (dihydrolipoamide acetyltransferase)
MIIEKDVLASINGAVKVTPLAAKIAAVSGVDLTSVKGTGSHGKITRADVLAIEMGNRSVRGERKIVPMRGMRKIIAEKMKQSQKENAQTYHRIAVRMDEAFRLREALEKAVGYNDIIAMAAVRGLKDFPAINSELTAEGIWQKDFVNLGVAVAINDGLIVPVVKDADLLSLRELSAAIKEMSGKARDGALQPDDYSGGTFTLSNLGMFGLEEFQAIINPPEAGILAVGKIEDTPVVVAAKDGSKAVEIHPVMKLTLTYDHRVIDGAPAAEFLSRVKEYLENPYRML